MPTNFPGSLDTFTDPNATDKLNSPSHSAQHATINAAVAAIEAKVGADNSAVTTSIDYAVSQLQAAVAAAQAVLATLGTAATHAATDFDAAGSAASAQAASQPHTSNLDTLSAATLDAFGVVLLSKATAAAVRSYIGAGTSSFSGAYSDLSGIPTTFTPSAHASSHAAAGSDPITIAESQVTNLVTDLAAKAALAGPSFTGTPTAPTAAVDTNTTQLATTAFVLAQASAAGDGTPEMDGTAARGTSTHYARADHVHPTDTSRAPLASPALSGTPTAPTATGGTSTTQIATTAFVQAALPTVPSAATQSDMETASSTTVYASPGRVQYHPGVAKAWVMFDGTGTPSLTASYNVSSITDNGTGDYTINLTTSFSSAFYCAVGMATHTSTANTIVERSDSSSLAAGAFRVFVLSVGAGLVDVNTVYVAFFGDQT